MKKRAPRITSVTNMITGRASLPDHYRIGNTCIRNHGVNGKTLRYKKSSACIVCSGLATKRATEKKYAHENRNCIKEIDDIAFRREMDNLDKEVWEE